MVLHIRSTQSTVQTSLSIFQSLLKDYHPRDFGIRLWDGTTWEAEAGQPTRFTMVIKHPGALRHMFLSPSERALGESYIYDDFDIEGNLEHTLPMAEYIAQLRLSVPSRARLASQLLSLPLPPRSRLGRLAAHLTGAVHSTGRDRQAVTYHYNTSNDFFAFYLGKEMIYSCAYFATPDEDLGTAQERKLDYICRKLRLQKGDRFLDIGCGWGGLVRYATRNHGTTSVGITLSEPQATLANERIKQEGLQDRCRVEVRDYRQFGEAGSFDKVASIGMVEHVGAMKLPEYFTSAWRLLRPGGVFLNHGVADHLHHGGPTFSQGYVFPDSEPVPISVSTGEAEKAGFEVRDVESLREHYMMTLRHWVRRLEARKDEAVRATDESTYRTWRLYMSVAAYEFETGMTNVYQSLLVKPDGYRSGLPLTRADWYR